MTLTFHDRWAFAFIALAAAALVLLVVVLALEVYVLGSCVLAGNEYVAHWRVGPFERVWRCG